MPKACDLKRGSIVDIDGTPHMVEDLTIQTPSARGGASLYKLRFRNLATKHKLDQSCKGDDSFRDTDFERRNVQFSYMQGNDYVFMDLDDYSELTLTPDDLGDAINYVTEDLEGIQALVSAGRVLGLELPATVDLDVEQCDPSIKGASATARTKPATLSTGLVIQVPEYLSPDERVRVDTRTGRFLGRA